MAQLDNLTVAEHPASVEPATAVDSIHFPDWLLVLAKRKDFIFKCVAPVVVSAIVIAFLLPNIYTAKARLMPPQQNQSMTTTAILSQLGPLASLASQGLGLKNASDLYVSMLQSETVGNALVDRFSLMSVYKKKLRVDARRKLEDRTLIVAGKDGIITISVDDTDPRQAAEIANAYVEELEKLTRTLAVSEAGQRRAFFERETKMASDDLAVAELALKQTQEKTHLILLDPQSRAMIESVSQLRARIAAQEIVVRSMRSFATAQNPDLERAEHELAAMRVQLEQVERGQGGGSPYDLPIERVPTAGLEYVRKLREVRYRETLFELLAKQFEAAKIDEARDTFLVQPLDKASVPERKSWPLRGLIVLGSTLMALFVAVLVAFLLDKLETAKEDPQFASQMQLFRFYFRRHPGS
jgi:uncharacterized protein involved in exopolysaccharide biosynthesis